MVGERQGTEDIYPKSWTKKPYSQPWQHDPTAVATGSNLAHRHQVDLSVQRIWILATVDAESFAVSLPMEQWRTSLVGQRDKIDAILQLLPGPCWQPPRYALAPGLSAAYQIGEKGRLQ